jgi:hypothetical protein
MEQKDHIQVAHYAKEARMLLDSVLPSADEKPTSDSSNQITDESKKINKTVDKREEALIRAFANATQSCTHIPNSPCSLLCHIPPSL